MLSILVVCIYTAPAQAQTVRQSLGELGWHGAGDDIDVHKPSMQLAGTSVWVWERSPLNNTWGNWMFVSVAYDCVARTQTVYATDGPDGYSVPISELTGRPAETVYPKAGSVQFKIMTSLCAEFGYTAEVAARLRQLPTPPDDGGPYNVVIRP